MTGILQRQYMLPAKESYVLKMETLKIQTVLQSHTLGLYGRKGLQEYHNSDGLTKEGL